MKNTLILTGMFLAGLVLNVGMSFADDDHEGDQRDQVREDVEGVPGPADSETGLVGVLMASGAAYLVWRRRGADFRKTNLL